MARCIKSILHIFGDVLSENKNKQNVKLKTFLDHAQKKVLLSGSISKTGKAVDIYVIFFVNVWDLGWAGIGWKQLMAGGSDSRPAPGGNRGAAPLPSRSPWGHEEHHGTIWKLETLFFPGHG